MRDATEIARMLVGIASDLQAADIRMLDISGVTTFADYFIILSADSDRQIRAVRDDMVRGLKQVSIRVRHSEGTPGSGWVLLDFGDVIVHIFEPLRRRHYQLEELWAKAIEVVRIQ